MESTHGLIRACFFALCGSSVLAGIVEEDDLCSRQRERFAA
jgi:hypothetical protein